MAYVKTQDGQVVKFPYTLGDFRKDNPNTSFPRLIPDEILASYEVFEVEVDTAPAVDEQNYKAVRADAPEYVSTEWRLQWSVVEKTDEEKQAYYDSAAAKVRGRRDRDLQECDWVVIKHTEKGTNIPAEWELYRQALRDITGQEGFPYSVTWPTKP